MWVYGVQGKAEEGVGGGEEELQTEEEEESAWVMRASMGVGGVEEVRVPMWVGAARARCREIRIWARAKARMVWFSQNIKC